ncbi:MAG TPA: hypothetical protein VJG30_05000 [Candidatus Nanoarchaeia archaeon]|nr:hypothetical protein [Candidatus Nanoarchaeia archaeon]
MKNTLTSMVLVAGAALGIDACATTEPSKKIRFDLQLTDLATGDTQTFTDGRLEYDPTSRECNFKAVPVEEGGAVDNYGNMIPSKAFPVYINDCRGAENPHVLVGSLTGFDDQGRAKVEHRTFYGKLRDGTWVQRDLKTGKFEVINELPDTVTKYLR